jgi:trehalose 6-phosphate synthase
MERRLLPHTADSRRHRLGHRPSDDLVVVANRLPVRLDTDGTLTRSPGGLVSALSAMNDGRNDEHMHWVGWLGNATDDAPAPPLADGTMHAVPLQRHEVTGYYDGFCNSLLWPLFHGRLQRLELNRSWWRTYRAVNQRFALTVARVAPPDATVWIHDYHLLLVPAMLRARRRDLRIGSFLHIPFPPAQLFAALPWRRELLLGMLAADMIGFQTQDDVDNFADSVERLVRGVRGRRERVTGIPAHAFPISVDFDQWSASGDRAAVAGTERRRELETDVVFLGVDRLDYTKGIANRLRAFGELLDQRRLDTATAVFVQIAVPSRDDIASYQEERDEIERLVREINDRHRRDDGTQPVVYISEQLDETALAEWYRAADCLVVTSLADGMNLVAKEFVASRSDLRGSVILSEFAGAANDLPGAMVVNPYDVEAIEKAMLQAVSMSVDEQRTRMTSMRDQVREHDLNEWARTYLSRLGNTTGRREIRRWPLATSGRDRRRVAR